MYILVVAIKTIFFRAGNWN